MPRTSSSSRNRRSSNRHGSGAGSGWATCSGLSRTKLWTVTTAVSVLSCRSLDQELKMDGDGMHPFIEICVDRETHCFTTKSDLWTADAHCPGGGYFEFKRPGDIPKGWYHHITFRLIDDGGLDLQFPP